VNLHRRERVAGSFDRNKISAEVNDGVLTLTLSKAESAKPRKIAIG
jgi:HSP20 family molecular chaperone IbpA